MQQFFECPTEREGGRKKEQEEEQERKHRSYSEQETTTIRERAKRGREKAHNSEQAMQRLQSFYFSVQKIALPLHKKQASQQEKKKKNA